MLRLPTPSRVVWGSANLGLHDAVSAYYRVVQPLMLHHRHFRERRGIDG
jgi:hypothetical protein